MSYLVDWNPATFGALEKRILLAEHRLHELDLFSDEGLVEILDRHPDAALGLSTMDRDSMTFEWRDGDRGGVSGETLLETVRRGQLWINCRQVMQHQPKLARLVDELYDELEAENPQFRAEDRTANLLISSPSAVVHYHVDMPVNMLWHLRGRKRVWVYPPFDTRVASLPVLEHVCCNKWSEEIPYDASYDTFAEVFDAEPGQLITWPQLTPHRVTNLDGLNVSLSTEHKNPAARRRLNVHQANYFLRNRLGLKPSSAEIDGWQAHAKQMLARGLRYAGKLLPNKPQPFAYPKSFVVDPNEPTGVRLLEGEAGQTAAPHLEYEIAGS
ncbi:cupin-like domain-containing protein [Roseimaritima sediminicola]|uniref:cupin-like domain-containing protein n=1 Tax=Roseimaritima sediminicola TaxID=2662066 RepID=UPI001298357A|nr:cupin-like domain-containing protein [Roseimaritima sediminicola]